MKRSDLTVGQELALGTSNDWDQNIYRIEKVTVVDTRGFYARRYRHTSQGAVTLQDGSTTEFFSLDTSKTNCLVRTQRGDVKLVSLAHLRGDYAECYARAQANQNLRAQTSHALEAARQASRARVTAAAQALKDLGVNVGYVSSFDTELKLGPTALEQILALINGAS